jgi:hypothetical protein
MGIRRKRDITGRMRWIMPKSDSTDLQKAKVTVCEFSEELMYWQDMSSVAERDVAALQRRSYSDDEVIGIIVNAVLVHFSDSNDEAF